MLHRSCTISTPITRIFTNITELHTLQQKLEHQAYYDELTQIYNRRAFFQQSEQSLIKVKDNLSSFTMILFDIDFFKKVNELWASNRRSNPCTCGSNM